MSFGNYSGSHNLHQLYSDHQSWLHGWLRRKLGCTHQAEDLTQDTFIRILAVNNKQGGLSFSEPRAFITTVANGILINWYRRQTLERAYLEALTMLPELQAQAPEQRLIILETLHEIDALLDSLPSKAKQAFCFRRLKVKNMKILLQK